METTRAEAPTERKHIEDDRELLDVPQLLESGLSADYRNVFLPFALLCRKYGGSFPEAFAKSGVRAGRIEKYLERFPPGHFRDVVNDHNREIIVRLDDLCDELNAMLLDREHFHAGRFLELCDEADRLILEAPEQAAA